MQAFGNPVYSHNATRRSYCHVFEFATTCHNAGLNTLASCRAPVSSILQNSPSPCSWNLKGYHNAAHQLLHPTLCLRFAKTSATENCCLPSIRERRLDIMYATLSETDLVSDLVCLAENFQSKLLMAFCERHHVLLR